jgi:hypothetical protein
MNVTLVTFSFGFSLASGGAAGVNSTRMTTACTAIAAAIAIVRHQLKRSCFVAGVGAIV